MSPALASSVGIVAYLALFMSVGLLFIFVNLLVGRFLRPNDPHAEKLEIYECGEPSIGSSYVQFDLRFYVVALLFIIFDVEVAFFFPWAAVFGKSTHLMDSRLPVVTAALDGKPALTPAADALYREMGVRHPEVPVQIPPSLAGQVDAQANEIIRSTQIVQQGARQLAWVTIADIAVFFAVLLIGFAYVWTRGDLDWVRAMSRERVQPGDQPAAPAEREAVLSA